MERSGKEGKREREEMEGEREREEERDSSCRELSCTNRANLRADGTSAYLLCLQSSLLLTCWKAVHAYTGQSGL